MHQLNLITVFLQPPRTSGSLLFAPGQTTKQPSTSSSSTTSYSAELFSCLADFTPTTVNTETSDSLNNSPPNENNTAAKPPVVSYMGSTPNTSAQTLARATTTSALGGSQENVAGLVRSKTVGGLPTMSSVVFAKGAAGTVLGRKDDGLPIAVAFIESVNAFFRGSDQSK